MRYSPSPGSLLGALKKLSKEACRLNEWFRKWRSDHHECDARVICATGLNKVDYWYGRIVEEASARYDIDHLYTKNKSNHFDVSKPKNRKDIQYRWLVDLMHPIMLEMDSDCQPVAPIEDTIARSAAVDSVETILRNLHNLEEMEGLQLPIVDMEKITIYEDLKARLHDGLKEAGLEYILTDEYFEHWEQVQLITSIGKGINSY
ncbi:unnamed protein product [Calypogeia fissa]